MPLNGCHSEGDFSGTRTWCSHQDSLHHRSSVQLSENVGPTHSGRDGCGPSQLRPWNLRGAFKKHQDHTPSKQEASPTCGHSPRPSRPKTEGWQATGRAHSSSKARTSRSHHRPDPCQGQDTRLLPGPAKSCHEG